MGKMCFFDKGLEPFLKNTHFNTVTSRYSIFVIDVKSRLTKFTNQTVSISSYLDLKLLFLLTNNLVL